MSTRSGRLRRRRDDGAAALEFAIILPVLLLLMIGMLEFSLVMRDWLGVSSAVRVGARIAATGAGAGEATCPGPPIICSPNSTPALAQSAAFAVQTAGIAMPKDQIDYIWVYKANSSGFPGTATNQAQADVAGCVGAANCVKFIWNRTLNQFVYAGGTWDSRQINACVYTPALGPGDAVGVLMRATHQFITRLFRSSMTVQDRSVSLFEPLPTLSCKPGEHA